MNGNLAHPLTLPLTKNLAMAQLCYFAVLTILLIMVSPGAADGNLGSHCVYSHAGPCNSSATNLIAEKCNPSGSGNYTHNSTYESNLLNVFSNLTFAARSSRAFYNASAGSGEDQVFGLFYCRGDVDSIHCLSCVEASASHLKGCNAREGFASYELCTLRYAKRAMVDTIERSLGNNTCDGPGGPTTPDISLFNQTVVTTMQRLTGRVTSGNSSSYFATESAKLYKDLKVYALVQCRPDLTGKRCEDCLTEALSLIVDACLYRGQVWGMYFQPSCQMRYDVVPFFNLTTTFTSPSPPAAVGSSSNSSGSLGESHD